MCFFQCGCAENFLYEKGSGKIPFLGAEVLSRHNLHYYRPNQNNQKQL